MPSIRSRKRAASPDSLQDARPSKKRGRPPSRKDTVEDKPALKRTPARGKSKIVKNDDSNASNSTPTIRRQADMMDIDSTTKPSSNQTKANAKSIDSAAKSGTKNTSAKGKKKTNTEAQDEETAEAEDHPKPVEADKEVTLDDMKADGLSTQFANLVIPVDEACTLTNYRVYVDEDHMIYDASLNQTNAGNNNNKFYRVQLLTDDDGRYITWTRWGRVGENGQHAQLGNGTLSDAQRHFEKKFKDKSGLKWTDRAERPKPGKYTFVERSYEPDSDHEEEKVKKEEETTPRKPILSKLQPSVQNLIRFICNPEYMEARIKDMNYDAKKLPLGKLSKGTILNGYQTLKDLSALFQDDSLAASKYQKSYDQAVENLSNQYYSYIPHDFGRNRPLVIRDHDLLRKAVEKLEELTELKDADAIIKANKDDVSIHPCDSQYNRLGMKEMTPVDQKSVEFSSIHEYLTKSAGSTHGTQYQVVDIFRVERQGERDRFKVVDQKSSGRKLLWHGSRSTNFSGILSEGLRIAPPAAPVSGYMFGKGIYLADMSSKSAQYCHHDGSGGEALLLLCEAELGKTSYELTNSSYTAGEDAAARGRLSTWGRGGTGPVAWKDASCIHPDLKGVQMPDTTKLPGPTSVKNARLLYNEYICYDVCQVRLRYLLRVKMTSTAGW